MTPLHNRTVAIQKSIETGERHPLSWFDTRTYIQHNPLLGDGFPALLSFLDSLPAGTSRVHAHRAFTDGDVSVAHLEYHLAPMGHVAGFEIHRWHDDRIVEHWDNLQLVPDSANPAGRGMFDGETELRDTHLVEANKALVEAFTRTVLIGGDADALDRHLDRHGYREHHPTRGDDPAALLEDVTIGSTVYRQLHRVLGGGNLVLALSEGLAGEVPSTFYDLYRLDAGRIVEHWDVVEPVVPLEQRQNTNGKF